MIESKAAPSLLSEKPALQGLDEPQALAPPEPAATQSLAPAEQVVASVGQPAETPVPSAAVAMSPPPPLASPLPAHRPWRPIVARHGVTAPQVRDNAPADVSQPAGALVAAATVPTALGQAVAAQIFTPPARAADQEAGLAARIRKAVQAAVHYPAAARMMGVTGRARVQLNYRNGVVDGPSLAQSSGMPVLDQAAINAAQGARYPETPPELAGRLMRFLVWVEFRSG